MEFQIEKGVEYVSTGKERENALSNAIAKTCLDLKANDSFMIDKDKFKKADWTSEKSRNQAAVYVRGCISKKIVNSNDFKVKANENGVRIWYKPKQETIIPTLKQEVKKVETPTT